MDVLSYADDITVICPSIGGFNELLKIYSKFTMDNRIIFYKKNTVLLLSVYSPFSNRDGETSII